MKSATQQQQAGQRSLDAHARSAGLLSPDQEARLRVLAAHYQARERTKLAIGNRLSAIDRADLPALPESLRETVLQTAAALGAYQGAEQHMLDRLEREMERVVAGSPLASFVAGQRGLGPAVLRFVGWLPRSVEAYHSVAALWKAVGLDVVDGAARRRIKGQKAGFNPWLRAAAIGRIGKAIEYRPFGTGGYRAIMDWRKQATLATHPPMLEDGCPTCDAARRKTAESRAGKAQTRVRTGVGFDCAAFGGPHWSDGHRRADAVRYAVKAFLCDLWRVAHGLAPRETTAHESPIAGLSPSVAEVL